MLMLYTLAALQITLLGSRTLFRRGSLGIVSAIGKEDSTSRLLGTSNRQMSHSTALFDDMTDVEDHFPPVPNVPMYWFPEVSSTMDTAREILKAQTKDKVPDLFSVVADYQTKGRGTRGRTWKYGNGNLFLTIGVHRSLLPIPMQYLPLRVGTLIAKAVAPYLNDASELKLKWPNDVLIDGQKVCGILIEMEDNHFIIGIGCNVMVAPPVMASGNESGRPSTALINHSRILQSYMEKLQNSSSAVLCDSLQVEQAVGGDELCDSNVTNRSGASSPTLSVPSVAHKRIASQMTSLFNEWLASGYDSPRQVISDFNRNLDFSEQLLRDRLNQPNARVQPLRLNDDGTLRVKYLHDNSETDLVAEYLF